MIKTLININILALFVLALFSGNQALAQTVPVVDCDSGSNLSYDQAVVSIAHGELVISRNPDLGSNQVTVTLTNNTPCNIPVSLASYKMYEAYSVSNVSKQEFFDGSSTINVGPSSSGSVTVSIPTCAAQYDFFYGNFLPVLVDNHPYGELLMGDQIRLGQYCVKPPSTPIAATLTASTVCAVPGTNITFIADISGDNINSATLEKDTNADGSYGQVISWGPGPRTSDYVTNEPASYTGVYSMRLMINGSEMARKNVTVSTSCGPIIVVPPPVTPPPVTPTPIAATLTASTICAVPGTNITFVADISGSNINSSTLEKDTNADGSYGEVISWGPGPRTSDYVTNEPASYIGVYSMRLMVNGTERARKNVTVSTSCGPIVVVPPPITPPPVIIVPPPVVVVPPPVTPPPVVVVVPPPVTPPPVVVVVTPPVTPPPVVVVVTPPVTPPPVIIIPGSGNSGMGGTSTGFFPPAPVYTNTPPGQVLGAAFIPTIYSFPKTGFGPLMKIIPLNVLMISLILALGIVSFGVDCFRKRRV